MNKVLLRFLSCCLMLVASPLLLAHHSAAAEYESRLILLKGKVTRVDWTNPHVWLYLDVTEANGTVAHWDCEGGAPGGLLRNGWNRNSLKPGDVITVEGSRAKDRDHGFKARAVRLPDGQRLIMGTIDEGIPGVRPPGGK